MIKNRLCFGTSLGNTPLPPNGTLACPTKLGMFLGRISPTMLVPQYINFLIHEVPVQVLVFHFFSFSLVSSRAKLVHKSPHKNTRLIVDTLPDQNGSMGTKPFGSVDPIPQANSVSPLQAQFHLHHHYTNWENTIQ